MYLVQKKVSFAKAVTPFRNIDAMFFCFFFFYELNEEGRASEPLEVVLLISLFAFLNLLWYEIRREFLKIVI